MKNLFRSIALMLALFTVAQATAPIASAQVIVQRPYRRPYRHHYRRPYYRRPYHRPYRRY